MAQPVFQHSFHSGEWAPALNARTDLQKYHAAAALMRNFFVDYRGGTSSRPGTRYILQCYKNTTVRLIPFQASFNVNYVLEFGDQYIRFFYHGIPILHAQTVITGATQANPCVVHDVAHGYNTGDWVFIDAIVGMTQLNNRYFQITKTDADHYSLQSTLDGSNINSTAYTAYSSGGEAFRVYTVSSPYLYTEVNQIKYAQNVDYLVLCHPNHPPYTLRINTINDWVLAPITFGTTVATPTGQSAVTTLAAGGVNYAYVITAVDANGQESAPSAAATLASKQDLRTTAGTNTISWTAVTGASSYNVYKAEVSYAGAIPSGSQFGFIGNVTGVSLVDSNIAPDFSQTPPIVENPFQGAGVAFTTITHAGVYDPPTVPSVTFAAAPAGGSTTTGVAVMTAVAATIGAGGSGYIVGEVMSFATGAVVRVDTVSLSVVTAVTLLAGGSVTGSMPINPLFQTSTTGHGSGCSIHFNYGVSAITLTSPGAGYSSAPAVTFTGGAGSDPAATATSTLGPTSTGNPSVPVFFQERLVLAAPTMAVNQFNMSQPGSPFNFNISDPIQASDAITGNIVSDRLNTIKGLRAMPSGLIALTDQQAFLINGGSPGAPITPIDATAQGQAYNGASDLPPIASNFDLLYVQSKGSIVRDLTFNFYTSIYTGTDISVLSSHLFFGYTLVSWAYAEEPFKVVWAVRSDGTLLSLTFVKEQEIIGWAHHDTQGDFRSVCTVTETVDQGSVDATYFIVGRSIGTPPTQFIERLADRFVTPFNTLTWWCVDSALQYDGAPATVISGLWHLVGLTVTGVADGNVVPPTLVAADGTVTLSSPASIVTLGLSFTPQLQTLQIDLGEPTAQGKRKKITAVTVRVQNALGLNIGKTFNSLVPMKDLVTGNVGSATNSVVSGLQTCDARTIIDPTWDVPGQYCLQQSNPYPVTILGVMPEIVVGDTR